MTPQYVTIHNTYNDASAINEIAYMHRNKAATSYHVAVDDKHVVQAIPFTRNAWHCGDGQGKGNRASIGIEICYSKSGGERYRQAEANAIEYVAHVLKQYGWGIDRVKKHQDWSGKYCPHRILDEKLWDNFKQRIANRLKELNSPQKTTVAVNSPQKEADEMTQRLLNDTGRDEAKQLIEKAVASGIFKETHLAKLDNYTDADLISYSIAYVNRIAKNAKGDRS